MRKILKKTEDLEAKYFSVWEDACNIESPTKYKEGVDRVGAYFAQMAKDAL